ncbi:transporter [Planctomycetales bacterium]|nr:transporter [Planctomycetales bacterium]
MIRPLSIPVALAAGALLTDARAGVPYLPYFIMGMLFIALLPVNLHDLHFRRQHWYLVGAGLLSGIIPWLIAQKFGTNDWLEMLFFCQLAPVASAMTTVVSFLRGKVGFCATAFVVDNLFIAVALLFFLPTMRATGGEPLDELALNIGQSLGMIFAVPFVLAQLARRLYPPVGEWSAKYKLGRVAFTLWWLVLFIVGAYTVDFLHHSGAVSGGQMLRVALLSLALCGFNFTLGYYLGGKEFPRECSQALGQKNTIFAIYLALAFANPVVAMAPIFYLLWQNLWNAWQLLAVAMGWRKTINNT